jgi:inner membrane protein
VLSLDSRLAPELRKRSIYQAVIYTMTVRATGVFDLPDLAALNIDPASLRLNETQLRFGISSAKGLPARSRRAVAGRRSR